MPLEISENVNEKFSEGLTNLRVTEADKWIKIVSI